MMLCDSCETEAHCRTFGCLDETPKVSNKTDVSALLEERGNRYGKFRDHAAISQMLKGVMDSVDKNMEADQREALEMIFHKIARILNGDPNYADSWVDIAGYAQLVADRLNGIER
jgi:hypothetical protein